MVPWAVKVSGKLGDCIRLHGSCRLVVSGLVAVKWQYGRSKSFVVRSVAIPSVVYVSSYDAPSGNCFSFDGDGGVRSSVRWGYLPLRVVLQMLT